MVFAVIVATIFYAITNISWLFHWSYGGTAFVNLLVVVCVCSSYFGAGYIGWRIADKHYHDHEKRFIRRYIQYSLLTFVVLVVVTYSPLSILGLLWSFVAPYGVLWSLEYVKGKSG